ncbi:hypothetical protein [Flexivirga oryzae]|uniref:Thioredoxin family protein n=1 Tax=Flexivirga oryzae TaxID=1794944 RepID=A0A839NBX3_9MICO|nr:hypothetical protein [Flexivirga oryzae]MBB2892082.1 hypothetical protein [Flexivirga oryzae]
MHITLLVVADCPNQQPAEHLLRQTLDDAGMASVPFDVRVVANQGDADRYGFTGSPTIQINGIDPFAQPGQPPAVACRVYPGGHGIPNALELRRALHQATADVAG